MFTPFPSFVGGLLLSYATSGLLVVQGRVLGCSGVAHGVIGAVASRLAPAAKPAPRSATTKDHGPAPASADGWKAATLAGMLAGGLLLRVVRPALEGVLGTSIFDMPMHVADVGVGRVIAAGLLVGAGTKVRRHFAFVTRNSLTLASAQLANGCTSGHMLLGLARLSKRSLAAVLAFFSTALTTSRLLPLPLLTAASSAASRGLAPAILSPTAAVALCLAAPLLSLPTFSYSRLVPSSVRPLFHAFLLGTTFSVGLALAGMTSPSKVISFFYVPLPVPSALAVPAGAAWDPSLAMVALGGLLPNMLVWQKIKGWKKPLEREVWNVPRGGNVDGKLLAGAALFGVGWGLMGCAPFDFRR